MHLQLKRLNDNGDSTIGYMTVNNHFQCYTIEDEFREVKQKGETRIPAGRYEILFRKVNSPMTRKYQQKYDFFTWHLELQDVPDFKYVYIHVGNNESNTDGCLIVGYSQESNTGMRNGFVGHSRDAYKDLYIKVAEQLNKGERVFITVEDE